MSSLGFGASQAVIRDTAGVTAGTGCVQVGAQEARCSVMPRTRRARRGLVVELFAYASDGADRLRFTGRRSRKPAATLDRVQLSGEAGDDTIVGEAVLDGGDGNDMLLNSGRSSVQHGGAGDDVMRGGSSGDAFAGGAGSDEVRAGGGDDHLSGDAPAPTFPDSPIPRDAPIFDPYGDASSVVAPDVLDGGGGSDTVDYEGSQPLSVDLSDPAPDGRPGESDVLIAIENVDGGGGPARLIGDNGPNRLSGGVGNAAKHLEVVTETMSS